MAALYNRNAPKKHTSLTVNSDLLEKAKGMNINISSTLEAALSETLKEKQRESWLNENKEAIKKYNAFVEENGLFSDGMRSF